MSTATEPPEHDLHKLQMSREGIIRTVQTPLGFFALVILVVEAILGVIAGMSTGISQTLAISGILVFVSALVAIVAFLAYSRPEALRGLRAEKIQGHDNSKIAFQATSTIRTRPCGRVLKALSLGHIGYGLRT